MAKVDMSGQVQPGMSTPCWIWLGCVHRRTGYGRFHFEGQTVEAHAASYRLLVGAVPSGLELDHLCRVRACVNPEHLEPVTHSVNASRSPVIGRSRSRKAHDIPASQTLNCARV
jgi:hypothetical protein